jgi:cytochrome c oxidase subunit 2
VKHSLVALGIGLATAAAVAGGDASAEGNARGRALFGLCAQCHGSEGHGNQLYMAPAIAGLTESYVERQLSNFRSGVRGLHFDDVAGMRMAPMARTLATDEDLRAVVAYVASLPAARPEPVLTGGDPERGKVFFEVCKQCHGPGATGDEKIGSAPLVHASDWYLFTQLTNFRAGIRGTNPADTHGPVMRPMSLTLPDEQALRDVISYITSLPEPAGE